MRSLTAVVVVSSLLLAACGGGTDGGTADDPTSTASSNANRDVLVVATTSILGDVVRQVASDGATVEVLMGPGVDPHAFQPSAAQSASLREADLVVTNGLGFEEGMLDALDAAEQEGVRVMELAPQLNPIEYDGADEHTSFDPHVWFDPTRMARGVALIADELEALAPGGGWRERAGAYAAELTKLDAELAATVDQIPAEQRRMVTNHDAIGYLAARYGLDVIETVLPGSSADAGPDARAFADLVETLEREDLRAIFAENISSDRLASALAAELGDDVRVVQLFTDAVGPPGSGAESYVGLLRTDIELIVEALTR